MTIETKLAAWAAQPGAGRTSSAEWEFIADMRRARDHGVGYGWMQQVIEWEWQAKQPGGSWGPEYYEGTIRTLEDQLAKTRAQPEAARTEVAAPNGYDKQLVHWAERLWIETGHPDAAHLHRELHARFIAVSPPLAREPE